MHVRLKVSAFACSFLLAGLALPVQDANAAPPVVTLVSGSEEDAGVSMGTPSTLKEDVVAPNTSAAAGAANTTATPNGTTARPQVLQEQVQATAAAASFNVGPLYVVGGTDVVPDAAASRLSLLNGWV